MSKFKVSQKGDDRNGQTGTVVNQTLTGHSIDEDTMQPVGGTRILFLQFEDGDERWYHEEFLQEVKK